MFTVRRLMGGYAASWCNGTEFIDPDPMRAAAMAAHDRLRALEAQAGRAMLAAEKLRGPRRVGLVHRELKPTKPRVRLIGGAA